MRHSRKCRAHRPTNSRCAAAGFLFSLIGAVSAGAQVWEVGDTAIGSDPAQAGAGWGASMVSADFNGDGFADLAVGEPDWDSPVYANCGRVRVFFGTANGLGGEVWSASYNQTGARFGAALAALDFDGRGRRAFLAIGIPGNSSLNVEAGQVFFYEYDGDWAYHSYLALGVGTYGGNGPNDHFGSVFAVADFDDDGYDDLAVGVPDKNLHNGDDDWPDAGTVHVFYGDDATPGNRDAWFWLELDPQAGAHAGSALAAGNFDGDDYPDLAVGIPDRDVDASGVKANAGMVKILHGSAAGLLSSGITTFVQSDFGDAVEAGDRFGAALASTDFDFSIFCVVLSCYSDLAIGVPGEGAGGGMVQIGYGSSTGIDPTDRQTFYQQNLADGASSAETGDGFGSVLLAGSFDGRFGGDLAIGVPDEDWNAVVDQGIVHLVFGGPSGLLSYPGQFVIASSGFDAAPGATGDRFGAALASGNFDGRWMPDLAIGLPGRTRSGKASAGLVEVVRSAVFADGFERGSWSGWSAASL